MRQVAALLFALSCSAAAAKCVLPVADGGPTNPSPAMLKGIIASASTKEITLVGVKGLTITLSDKTEMFTVYGGWVQPTELKSGLHAFVWLVDCKKPKGNKAQAAVVQVCATEPIPCLK
jgi:hypothetical protein